MAADTSHLDTCKEVFIPPRLAECMTTNFSQHSPSSSPPETAPEVQPSLAPEVVEKPSSDAPPGTAATTASLATASEAREAPSTSSSQRSSHACWRRSWRFWVVVGLLSVVCVIGVILGAVFGTRMTHQQNVEGDSSSSENEDSQSRTDSGTKTEARTEPESSFTPAPIATPMPDDIAIGTTLNSSFTYYGTGDQGQSVTCNTYKNGCNFYTKPGFAAAVSQNLYGAAPYTGPGLACGTCWRLHAQADSSGCDMNRTIVVKVNNICPAEGNPVCGQHSLQDANTWDAQVNFNLCIDSGASDGLLGANSGIGLAVGTATRVGCDEWEGIVMEGQ